MINLECEPWLWNEIVKYLRIRTGLACDYLGSLNVRRSIAHRMQITQTKTVTNYWFQLQQQNTEWQAFLNEVVVPETSFFRDRVPFELLANWSRDRFAHWLAHRSSLENLPKLRILSLPCSTGEEAYSIALSLLGAGLALDQFEIKAIDLSDRALTIAKEGKYHIKPLGSLWENSCRYWNWQNDTLQIRPEVKRSIDFQWGNVIDLIAQNNASNDSFYDVIFCRNLLIYLDQKTRQQVLDACDRILKTDGLLFVGHTETGAFSQDRLRSVIDHQWTAFPHSYAFAYQKLVHLPKRDGLSSLPLLRKRPDQPQPIPNKHHSPVQNRKYIKSNIKSNIKSKVQSHQSLRSISKSGDRDLLQRSQSLADQGQLEAALNCCERHLKSQPLCGEGYFLMGQILQAIGALVESDRYLSRAIYLMPNHVDALMQLALLRESQGDRSRAEVLRQRLKRSLRITS